MKTLTFLLLLLVIPAFVVAQAGHNQTPAGSKIGNRTEQPHHYHPPKFKHSKKPDSISKKRKHSHRHKLHPFYGLHPRVKYYRRTPVYIEKPVEPKVTRQKTIIKTRTRYIPAPPPQPSATLCGGDTVYLRDKNTGEITIRYVSPAKKC